MKVARLIMITLENNNKFYNMSENPDGTFTVKYGRVNKTEQTESYPISAWEKKHKEKLKKGYKDVTHLFVESVTSDGSTTSTALIDISDSKVKNLFDTLQAYANKSIKQNYTVSAENVTQLQVDEAQAALDKIAIELKVGVSCEVINKHLLELFMIVPREMKSVKDHLIQSNIATKKDLEIAQEVIAKEQGILDVMAGQVAQIKATKNAGNPKEIKKSLNVLEAMGLEITPITDSKIIDLIKDKLNDLKRNGQQDNSKLFKQAFQVTNKKTQVLFDKHLASASDKKTELFWHGSRNANYLSIAEKGLLIRPAGAGYNGSMFSDGIYFGNQSGKSLNYTDYRGAYRSYTSGNSNRVFLLLFDVHVGNPLHIYKHDSSCYTIDKRVKKEGYDCVWAHAGASLAYDEVIIYNSNQCTIKYIIELEG